MRDRVARRNEVGDLREVSFRVEKVPNLGSEVVQLPAITRAEIDENSSVFELPHDDMSRRDEPRMRIDRHDGGG